MSAEASFESKYFELAVGFAHEANFVRDQIMAKHVELENIPDNGSNVVQPDILKCREEVKAQLADEIDSLQARFNFNVSAADSCLNHAGFKLPKS
jgi:hypothetical protein